MIWSMIEYGLRSIMLSEPRRTKRRQPREFLTSAERWRLLGERLRTAIDKTIDPTKGDSLCQQ